MEETVTWISDGQAEPLVHRRSVSIEVFDDGDLLELDCRLMDERPWTNDAPENQPVVHHMRLRIKVEKATSMITAADAQMLMQPHVECKDILGDYQGLVGISVARGYNKAIQERFGRERGCSHFEFMAKAIGTAVLQGILSAARREDWLAGNEFELPDNADAILLNTCHVWTEDGTGFAKRALGWKPGIGGWPTPELVEIRRLLSDGSS
jgi:hypothetical protein